MGRYDPKSFTLSPFLNFEIEVLGNCQHVNSNERKATQDDCSGIESLPTRLRDLALAGGVSAKGQEFWRGHVYDGSPEF